MADEKKTIEMLAPSQFEILRTMLEKREQRDQRLEEQVQAIATRQESTDRKLDDHIAATERRRKAQDADNKLLHEQIDFLTRRMNEESEAERRRNSHGVRELRKSNEANNEMQETVNAIGAHVDHSIGRLSNKVDGFEKRFAAIEKPVTATLAETKAQSTELETQTSALARMEKEGAKDAKAARRDRVLMILAGVASAVSYILNLLNHH